MVGTASTISPLTTVKRNAIMKIFVHILGRPGGGLKLDVEPTDSLDCIRAKVCHEKSIPPAHQKFIFREKVLEEGSRPISEYHIRQWSILSLAIKRPGDLSTHVGCDFCEVTISAITEDYMVWLCETCA